MSAHTARHTSRKDTSETRLQQRQTGHATVVCLVLLHYNIMMPHRQGKRTEARHEKDNLHRASTTHTQTASPSRQESTSVGIAPLSASSAGGSTAQLTQGKHASAIKISTPSTTYRETPQVRNSSTAGSTRLSQLTCLPRILQLRARRWRVGSACGLARLCHKTWRNLRPDGCITNCTTVS